MKAITLKRFWIAHPAMSEPVGLWRWLQFQMAQWLMDIGERGKQLEHWALYRTSYDDDIPF